MNHQDSAILASAQRDTVWKRHASAAAKLTGLAMMVACTAVELPETTSGTGGTAAGGGGSGGDTTSAGGGGNGGGGNGGTVQPDGCYDTLASDVSLDDISFFQVVGIDIMRDQQDVAPHWRNAPLIQNRSAVVRTAVAVGSDFTARELGVRIAVNTSSGTETFITKRMVSASSTDADPASQFTIDLPAGVMEADATYSVSLVECASPTGTPSATARYPETGDAELAAVDTGPIKIRLIPFEIGGFVPDTSQTVLDGFRDAMLSVYPTNDVQLIVAPTIPDAYGGVVDMGDILVDTGILQDSEPQPDIYYYGLVTGAATRAEFCDDCPTGTSQEISSRAGFAVGAAFADQKSEDTLIHELGHLHGLQHAPCGDPSGVDLLFPYPEADITVEGYDFRTATFVPADHKDMMSYCFPRWVSDYNFAKLTAWVQMAQEQWTTSNAQSDRSSSLRAAPHRCF